MELDAVFSGGGVRGIGIVGALSVFEAEGFRFVGRSGTSAGAIIGGLHAAGYSAAELESVLLEQDFARRLVARGGPADAGPRGIRKLIRAARARWSSLARPNRPVGLFSSQGFEELFRELLERKGVRTFRDLRLPDDGGPPRYGVRVVGADITRGRLVILPDDAAVYDGYDSPDDFEVARALRVSMGIPGIFRPVVLTANGQRCLLVDGGLVSRYPLVSLTHGPNPVRPTVGFYVPWPTTVTVRGPLTLGLACALTALQANDAHHAERWKDRTVVVDGRGVSAVKFWLSREQKRSLFDRGAAAARACLESPQFRERLESPSL